MIYFKPDENGIGSSYTETNRIKSSNCTIPTKIFNINKMKDNPYNSLDDFIKSLETKLRHLETEIETNDTLGIEYSKENYNIFRNTLIKVITKLKS